ncbi:MAG: hypothetical protein GY904_32415, partial [Planctomycetaceae bacterium]|nr:hypothetical protein [Planctomycetaceae bacterium]
IMMTSYDSDAAPANRFPKLDSDAGSASSRHLDRVASMIAAADNPIIVTESFAETEDATQLLDSFANVIAAPVFEWWMPAYKNIDRTSPLHGKGNVEAVLGEADVVIVLCSNGPWHPPMQALRPGCQVILIDQEPLRPASAYWGYETTVCVSGDPVENLSVILQTLKDSPQLTENQAEIAKRIRRWTEYNKAQQLAFEKTTSDEVVATESKAKIHAST